MAKQEDGKSKGKSPTKLNSNRIGAGQKPKVTRTAEGKVDWGKFANDNKRTPSKKGISRLQTTVAKKQVAKAEPVKKVAAPKKASPSKGLARIRKVAPKSAPTKGRAISKKTPSKDR